MTLCRLAPTPNRALPLGSTAHLTGPVFRAALFLVLIIPMNRTVWAQEESKAVSNRPASVVADRAPYRLVFDHLTGAVALRSNKDHLLETWDRTATPIVPVPPNRPLVVVINNANTLLYQYSVEAEVVRTSRIRSCRNVVREFGSQGFLVSATVVRGTSMPALDPDQVLGSLLKLDVSAFGGVRGDSTQKMDATTLRQTLRNVRDPLTNYATFLEGVASLTTSLQDSLTLMAAQGEVEPIDSLLARLQASLEAVHPGLSDPRRVPMILLEATRQVAPQLGALTLAYEAITDGRYSGSSSDEDVQPALDLQARIQKAQQAVQEAAPPLQGHLAEIERARQQATQRFTLNPGAETYRHVTITLRATENRKEVLRFREGAVDLYTEPRRGLLCQLALGVTWIDEPVAYGVEDGEIVNTADEGPRIAAHLLLHLASPRFPLIGGLMGVGIGKNNRPDFYLGGSLRLLDPLMINVGVVWQRTPRLPDGLAVGQAVDDTFDPMDLDTDTLDKRYESGLFFGISFVR